MKFSLNIIRTTFYLPIEIGKETEALDSAKFTVETYGLKELKKSTITTPIYRTTSIFQHLFFHPFAKTTTTTLEVEQTEDSSRLKYRIRHPFSLLIPLVSLIIVLNSGEERLILIPPILFLEEQVLIFFMQISVIKQIRKSIEKDLREDILDD